MNFLWEVMIQAERERIPVEKLRFCIPKVFSAYLEVSNPFINQSSLELEPYIEVNPYYRFYDIFKELYQPDYQQGEDLRSGLVNLFIHQLAENDVLSGMTKEEYYKSLMLKDISRGKNGRLAQNIASLFNIGEQQVILSGLLRQYRTGCSIDLFREMMKALIPNNIVYHNNDRQREVLIYIGEKKRDTLEKKLRFLVCGFLDLAAYVDIYYEYHFGIIGVEETMIIGDIAIY